MSADRLTELLNYMSAMSRDIGEFRAEMKARMDGLEIRIGSLENRIGSLETEMRTGFEQVRTDIRHLKQRFEIVSEDLMELRTDGRDLRKRMEVLEKQQA